jgi:hypothetical protein
MIIMSLSMPMNFILKSGNYIVAQLCVYYQSTYGHKTYLHFRCDYNNL